jgi:redox-regulated HSP33 family molecular chaperone
MVQTMPGADEKTISMIEANVNRMPQATLMIRDSASPVDLLHAALGVIEFEALGEWPVSFSCSCSFCWRRVGKKQVVVAQIAVVAVERAEGVGSLFEHLFGHGD